MVFAAYLLAFLLYTSPYWLGIGGVILIICGLASRRSARKTRIILTAIGIALLFPIIGVGISKLDKLATGYNSLTHQMFYGTADDMERVLARGVEPDCHAGYSKNIPAKEGEYTMLSNVCSYNSHYDDSLEKARLLIEYGADVNWRTCPNCTNGRHGIFGCEFTPLMFLCEYPGPQSKDMVILLLDNGADINAKNHEGQTALDMVNRKIDLQSINGGTPGESWLELKALLIKRGAKTGNLVR